MLNLQGLVYALAAYFGMLHIQVSGPALSQRWGDIAHFIPPIMSKAAGSWAAVQWPHSLQNLQCEQSFANGTAHFGACFTLRV